MYHCVEKIQIDIVCSYGVEWMGQNQIKEFTILHGGEDTNWIKYQIIKIEYDDPVEKLEMVENLQVYVEKSKNMYF